MEVTFIEKWSNISFCSYQDLWVFQRYKISYLDGFCFQCEPWLLLLRSSKKEQRRKKKSRLLVFVELANPLHSFILKFCSISLLSLIIYEKLQQSYFIIILALVIYTYCLPSTCLVTLLPWILLPCCLSIMIFDWMYDCFRSTVLINWFFLTRIFLLWQVDVMILMIWHQLWNFIYIYRALGIV